MTGLDDYRAALAAADRDRDTATRDADRRQQALLDAAATALAEALAAHDEVVGKAEAEHRAATEAARSEHRSAVTEAERVLDAAKQREHDAPDARIEQASGTLFLRAGRSTLGSATPIHAGHWRLVVGERIVFMPPDPVAARVALWDVLAADPVPVP